MPDRIQKWIENEDYDNITKFVTSPKNLDFLPQIIFATLDSAENKELQKSIFGSQHDMTSEMLLLIASTLIQYVVSKKGQAFNRAIARVNAISKQFWLKPLIGEVFEKNFKYECNFNGLFAYQELILNGVIPNHGVNKIVGNIILNCPDRYSMVREAIETKLITIDDLAMEIIALYKEPNREANLEALIIVREYLISLGELSMQHRQILNELTKRINLLNAYKQDDERNKRYLDDYEET